MGHLRSETALVHSCNGVAAADDGDAAVSLDFRHSAADTEGTLVEFFHFKHAHRTVPDDRLGSFDGVGVEFNRLGTDIKTHPAFGDVLTNDLGVGFSVKLVSGNGINGEQEVHAFFLGGGQHFLGIFQLIIFAEGVADLVTHSFQEGVSHAAADDQGIDLVQQVLDHSQLVGDFCTAEDGNKRTDRVFNRIAQVFDFFFQQEAGNGSADVLGDDSGGSVSAMSSTERIVAENIAIGSQLLRQFLLLILQSGLARFEIFIGFAVFLLALRLFFLVIAGVFQHHDIAVLHGCDFGIGCSAVSNENDFLTQELAQVVGNDLHGGVAGDTFFIRSAHMAHEDELAALFDHIFDGGESALDTGVVFDHAFFDRHVEVNAHDHAFAFEFHITQSFLVHFCFFFLCVQL